HADAGVGDLEQDVGTGLDICMLRGVTRVEDDVGGPDRERAPGRHRVASIDREVEADLPELAAVDDDGLDVAVEARRRHDVVADQTVDEVQRLGDDLVDVALLRPQDLLAAEGEELTREMRGAFGGSVDLDDVSLDFRPSVSAAQLRMTIRMLLKSCAIPPARLPIASIFCDCRSCSSS